MRKTAKLSRTTTRKNRRGEIRRNPRASGPKKNKTDEPPVKSLKATTTRKSLKVKAKSAPAGVQKHGKEWENAIITVVVSSSDLEDALNQPHTATHDVPKRFNKINPGTHLSIKATGSNRVDFGDAKRTIQNLSKPDSPLEAIVVRYRQVGEQKRPTSVLHINLTAAKDALLGTDPDNNLLERIKELDTMVKNNSPSYKETTEALKKYMKDSGARLVVAPKIGNPDVKRPGRLQISLSSVNDFINEYPEFVTIDKDCKVYGKDCLRTLQSGKRVIKRTNAASPAAASAASAASAAYAASPESAAFAAELTNVVIKDNQDKDTKYLAEEARKKWLDKQPDVKMSSMR
jgi:hypothetical protein